MSSGIVLSKTFTPTQSGDLIVSATYDSQGVASDWGAGLRSKLFVLQNAVTTYSAGLGISTSRVSQGMTNTFEVVAGLPLTFGLYGELTGAVAATWWNVNITAQLIYVDPP